MAERDMAERDMAERDMAERDTAERDTAKPGVRKTHGTSLGDSTERSGSDDARSAVSPETASDAEALHQLLAADTVAELSDGESSPPRLSGD